MNNKNRRDKKSCLSARSNKRDFTKKFKSIRISPLWFNVPPLYHDWPRSLNYEEGKLFELHGRKGGYERYLLYFIFHAAIDILSN